MTDRPGLGQGARASGKESVIDGRSPDAEAAEARDAADRKKNARKTASDAKRSSGSKKSTTSSRSTKATGTSTRKSGSRKSATSTATGEDAKGFKTPDPVGEQLDRQASLAQGQPNNPRARNPMLDPNADPALTPVPSQDPDRRPDLNRELALGSAQIAERLQPAIPQRVTRNTNEVVEIEGTRL